MSDWTSARRLPGIAHRCAGLFWDRGTHTKWPALPSRAQGQTLRASRLLTGPTNSPMERRGHRQGPGKT
eukprot:9363623-Alexandrium_andersonii.AAC.1